MMINNFKKETEIALVINWKFHTHNKWVSVTTPYFVDAFIEEFNPLIISSQLEYELFKKKIKYIVSMEPGWAAPKIKYNKNMGHIIGVFASDPHNKINWFQEYVESNNITYVFSQYCSAFFYHFPKFPKERFIHFPWSVPDELIPKNNIELHDADIMIFGGQNSEAYDIRNWCRKQPDIIAFDNSGVENKKLSNKEYFDWLGTFDAIVAAGSSSPIYDLVTPKYFETAAVGSLLIGQSCTDLEKLGFNETNMLIFEKDNFNLKVQGYLKNKAGSLEKRKKGKQLILERHLVSHRVSYIKTLFNI